MRLWHQRMIRLASAVVLFVSFGPPTVGQPAGSIPWQEFSDEAFARAKREGRLVLLDLGAVWCHWCHVMEQTTYRDPTVVALVSGHFVAVRVDQDARPDLSNRYEDYGWPATVIFDATGKELVKFSGYVPPPRMISLLQAVIDDPTPGPSARALAPSRLAQASAPVGLSLSPKLLGELERLLVERYDEEHAGTKGQHAAEYFALPDAERRRLGIPRVDTHVYTRETAWAAYGLLALHEATGDAAYRREASRVGSSTRRPPLASSTRGSGAPARQAS